MVAATKFQPRCLPTAVGSMPHTDPNAACKMVLRFLRDVPAWPQLPRRSVRENMYVQFSEGFPGFVVEDDRFYVNRSVAQDSLEKLYQVYLEDKFQNWGTTEDYAAGLYYFKKAVSPSVRVQRYAVKGQITGPISWGLTVVDGEKRPVLYDDMLADALAKHLRLKAAWQEMFLIGHSGFRIISVDEPYMSAFGSAYVSLTKEKVVNLLEEVFKGIQDLKGLHCCGNTDWSVLLGTSVNIINPDVYNYANSFNLYPDEIKTFLAGGSKAGGREERAIAWGIVPNDEASLKKETVFSLRDRLEEVIAPVTRKGIPFRQLLENSLITPSCGLSSMSIQGAESALEMLADLSRELKRKYFGELT